MALLLLTGTPGDVLARIVPGDPLGIALCVGRELRRGAFLLDAERVTRRAFARCARASASWRGDPALAPWLRERVREAIEDLCRHELGRHDLGHGPGAPRPAEHGGGAFETIAAPLGLRVRSLRQACARFNGLARGEREAFFSILIDGQPLEQAAQRAGIALHEAARRARRGLELFRRAGVAAELPRATQAETRAP